MRNNVLEIFHRLQANNIFEPYAVEVIESLHKYLKQENEDNGILCLKIISIYHKHYKQVLKDEVIPFFDIIVELYGNMSQVVTDTFNTTGQLASGSTPAGSSFQSPRPMSPPLTGDLSNDSPKSLPRAMYSFKTVAECPITVVSIFTSYQSMIIDLLPMIIPCIINILKLQAAPQAEARAAAAASNELFTSVSPYIKNRSLYGEFIHAQGKAVTFLAFTFLRGYSTSFKTYLPQIPDLIIRLLQDCPCELSLTRKEILHSLRLILSTEFRTLFIPKFDILFNEKVLIGDGLTAHETLRRLAYSAVADFIYNIRAELSLPQLWKIVRVFCKNLKDDTLCVTAHTVTAKSLVNLLDKIAKLTDKNEARQLFMLIIDSYVHRFISLNCAHDNIMKRHAAYVKKMDEKKAKPPIYGRYKLIKKADLTSGNDIEDVEMTSAEDVTKEEKKDNKMDIDQDLSAEEEQEDAFDYYDLQNELPIKVLPEQSTDPLKEARLLFGTLMTFLKAVMQRTCNPQPPGPDYNPQQQWKDNSRVFSYDEVIVLTKLFREGVKGLIFFSNHKRQIDPKSSEYDFAISNSPITSSKEEKDMMEIFATMFIPIDPASFNEIITSEIQFLYDQLFINPGLLHIPQIFLASELTSANFFGVLIGFLKGKLEELGQLEPVKSNILIRLFKFCFMSVNVFPSQNEKVLLPHLNDFILKAFELSKTAKEPLVYFYLMRTLFRSIGGGGFENLYKEIMPLLQVVLETLNKLLVAARRPLECDIFVELCLTVPVRLSVLVPHLSYLMRPLVYALNGSQDLVTQGLRTLELCVDNLTPEYFDPIIEPVIEEVMEALWNHLQPMPYYHLHSHTTFRILGKLGGRNRRFVKPPHDLKAQSVLNQDIKVMTSIIGLADHVPVSITPAVDSALRLLENKKAPQFYRIQSYNYLSNILKVFIDSSDVPKDYAKDVRRAADALLESTIPGDKVLEPYIVKDDLKLDNRQKLFVRLLEAVFFSTSIPEVKDDALLLIKGISDHATILNLGTGIRNRKKNESIFSVNDHEGKAYLSERAIIDAITYALSSYMEDVREAGKDVICHIYKTCLTIYGSPEKAVAFPFIKVLFHNFAHVCFEEPYYRKSSGCLGLQVMIETLDFPLGFLKYRQVEFVRAMLFVLRDLTVESPSDVRELAKDLLLLVLRKCNTDVTEEDLSKRQFQAITGTLIYDLSNANSVVRDVSQQALQVLSEVTGFSVAKIIKPSKGILITPIFGKPLRALPFPMQIGNIDAITFVLGLEGTFLEFNEELTRLLHEAVALVDAEDESLISIQKALEYKTSQEIIKLRVVCVKLLALALTKPEFSAQHPQTRIKVLTVFFKTLNSTSSEVIAAAHEGLGAVLSTSPNPKIPKDLLHNGLAPMLAGLSDYKKLNVHGLESLGGLLKLFVSYFKVEIGRKLLDHLMSLAQPNELYAIAAQDLETNNGVLVIKAILNIFHLLPPTAHMFIEDIIQTLQFLEDNLRRRHYSPFREPVAKFLNKYPKESFEFFLKYFSDRIKGTKLAYFSNQKVCGNLTEYFKEHIDSIKNIVSGEDVKEVKNVQIANTVDLLYSLVQSDKSWLLSQKSFLLTLLTQVGKIFDFDNVDREPLNHFHIQQQQTVVKLQDIFCYYLENNLNDHDTVLELIDTLSSSNIPLINELHVFIHKNIVSSNDIKLKESYLSHCVTKILNKSVGLSTRTFILKYIANPILMTEGRRHGNLNRFGQKISSGYKFPHWLDQIHTKVWRGGVLESSTDNLGVVDHYRFEFLQMSAIFIKYGRELIEGLRKDLIKFGWNSLKHEDALCKQAAYVVIAYFIAAYDTPSKIVIQIYVALLRSHESEMRHLVRQALDLLAPVLPKRMAAPLWVKYPRRVLSEYGYNVSQVVNVYQFIVRHSNLFFDSRDHFIPNIVSAITKLSVHHPMNETQNLVIELAELMLKWENTAKLREDINSGKTSSDGYTEEELGLPPGSNRDSMTLQSYVVPTNQRETTVICLTRFVCMTNTRASDTEVGKRALAVLYELLGPDHWPEIPDKLLRFERFLTKTDLSSPSILGYCLNTLEVLDVTLEWKSKNWIIENLPYLEKLLENPLKSENMDIQVVLQRILKFILIAINEAFTDEESEKPESVGSFINSLVEIIQKDLNGTTSVPAGLILCSTLGKHSLTSMAPLLPLIVSTFIKLSKDPIAFTQQPTQTGPQQPNTKILPSEIETKKTINLFIQLIELVSLGITDLDREKRRIFLSFLGQLIERSFDIDLQQKIISTVKTWVFSKQDFPTTLEKAAILGKMMIFEARNQSPLTEELFEIIVHIFEEPSFARTELTVKMEQPFLVGTRLKNIGIRSRLMSILNESFDRDIYKRLHYVIREQNWEYLADYPWLKQALQLLYGSADNDYIIHLEKGEYKLAPSSSITDALPNESSEDIVITDELQDLVFRHSDFLKKIKNIHFNDIFAPLTEIHYQNPESIHKSWIDFFPVAYQSVPTRERMDFLRSLITLVSKDYHGKQRDKRPNVIKTILEAVGNCESLQLPSHLTKYLGSNFDAWFPALKILEDIEEKPISDSAKIRETNLDALVEMYSLLQEDDMFYGVWRRRAKYQETNAAVSFEQIGFWDKALQLYESAQVKARSGVLPYGVSEYSLWEDNWILCAQKLQHWEILTELAKHEGFTDLLLECGWRVADWTNDKEPLEQSVKTVMDVPTPRRQIFETFICLQGYSQNTTSLSELSGLCDEGIQLALRKWHLLPKRFTNAHITLLHTFQQYVEFMEASQVYESLKATTVTNLDVKSQELKRVLQAWRERLPNIWDDINIWNDLVTWRRHAFSVINKVYMPFIPALQEANGNANANSYAYRGFHEIAWVINRFAHVARKHNMPQVCINQLTKIYTLPNIEIQEAFLKLREQAKCHYRNPKELNTGLDVISNTNLVYFATQQKAEFFTLKGMFLAKLNSNDEANDAFATAVQIDLNLAKAWAEWGFFNDRRFKEDPIDMSHAVNAISCYLQAAGLYKNSKTRKLLSRILWLISLYDSSGSLTKAFENYRGEVPVWYWITYIPQLLTSLSHKEAKLVRHILIRIAKTFPQSLQFQLRTTKEDFAVLQKQAIQAARNKNNNPQGSPVNVNSNLNRVNTLSPGFNQSNATSNTGGQNPGTPSNGVNTGINGPGNGTRQPWENVDEIMGILKTAYPLLALSLESLVDQINQRFKSNADEDSYRLVVALLNDGIQYMNRSGNPRIDASLPSSTEANISRFAETVLPKQIRAAFEEDFIKTKPNLETYIIKLRIWRDRLEEKLDRRMKTLNLESVCPHLCEFHHQKFEDIEVPGQYLLNKDNNTHFIRIERFLPKLDLVRGFNACYKRLHIRGHDGSLHSFSVQYPAARHCRREERVFQIFRIFNDTLLRKVESRKRNIQFTIPVAIPLSPHIRIMTDTQYVTLQTIYENFCRQNGKGRDDPFVYTIEQLRATYDLRLPKPDINGVRTEILSGIQATIVPTTVLRDHFSQLYPAYEDFWLSRKQFTSQYAGFIFMTFLMCISHRQPHKIHIDSSSGDIWTSEMLPCISYQKQTTTTGTTGAPMFYNNEPTPFRLTPNIQKYIGPAGLEGILSVYLLTIGRCLTLPEFDMEQFLSLFVRDEIISWFAQQHRTSAQDSHLRELVKGNVEILIKRSTTLAHVSQNSVATQTVLDLISQAVNPRNLAASETLWMAYL